MAADCIETTAETPLESDKQITTRTDELDLPQGTLFRTIVKVRRGPDVGGERRHDVRAGDDTVTAVKIGPALAGEVAYPALTVASDLVVSVGYERRSIGDLVDLLRDYEIAVLLDVREVAFSHRPEYRKGALQRALEEAGIRYIHLPVAGNPYRDQRGDIARCLSAYRRHLKRSPAVIDRVLEAIATADAVAMLCYERVHQKCHRSVLLEALAAVASLEVLTVE